MARTPTVLIPYVDIAINTGRKISHSVKMQLCRWDFNPHKLRRVLINILDPGNGIGDYIQSSPLVRALRRTSPDAEISYLVSEKPELAIFKLFPIPVSVISLHPSQVNPDFLSIFAEKELRPECFDLIIHAHTENPHLALIITQKGGFRNSIGYYKKEHQGYNAFLSMRLPNQGPLDRYPERQFPYDSNLKRLLDVKIEWEPRLVIRDGGEIEDIPDSIEQAKRNGAKILGLHPGCHTNAKGRRWSPENFMRLALWFRKQFNGKVLIFGGPHEEVDVREIVAEAGDCEVIAILGKPLMKVGRLVNLCDVFVSNDSGLMNLSMALGVPSIAICGPSCTESLHSLYPKGIFLGDKMPCCPCYHTDHYMSCVKDSDYSAMCLQLIKPDEVIEHIKGKLVSNDVNSKTN